jgi:hypothetical protein
LASFLMVNLEGGANRAHSVGSGGGGYKQAALQYIAA